MKSIKHIALALFLLIGSTLFSQIDQAEIDQLQLKPQKEQKEQEYYDVIRALDSAGFFSYILTPNYTFHSDSLGAMMSKYLRNELGGASTPDGDGDSTNELQGISQVLGKNDSLPDQSQIYAQENFSIIGGPLATIKLESQFGNTDIFSLNGFVNLYAPNEDVSLSSPMQLRNQGKLVLLDGYPIDDSTDILKGNFSKNPSDLNQEGASLGQILKWDGSNWVPADDTTGGGGTTETVSAGFGTIVSKAGNDYEVRVDPTEIASQDDLTTTSDSLDKKIPSGFIVSLDTFNSSGNYITTVNEFGDVLKQVIRPFDTTRSIFDITQTYWNGDLIMDGNDNSAPYRVDGSTIGGNHENGAFNINRKYTILIDNKEVHDFNRFYYPKKTFTVREYYDLQGFDTDTIIAKVSNTYVFDANGNCVIYSDYYALKDVVLNDIMFLMNIPLEGDYSQYVPKSLPFTLVGVPYDMSKPYDMSGFAPTHTFAFDSTNTISTGILADRVIAIKPDVAFAMGFLPVKDAGINRRRELAVDKAMEIRYNTKKMYMSAIDPENGDTLRAGSYYSINGYKSWFRPVSGTTDSYFLNVKNFTYGYLDWHLRNLFDYNQIKNEKYLNSGTGALTSATGDPRWKASGYIPVEEGETYTLSGDRGRIGLSWFATNGTNAALSYVSDATMPLTVTAPAGANYAIFNIASSSDSLFSNIQFEKGDVATGYQFQKGGKITDRINLPDDIIGEDFTIVEKDSGVSVLTSNSGSILFEIDTSGYAILKFSKPSDTADLSNYAQLSGATFSGDVSAANGDFTGGIVKAYNVQPIASKIDDANDFAEFTRYKEGIYMFTVGALSVNYPSLAGQCITFSVSAEGNVSDRIMNIYHDVLVDEWYFRRIRNNATEGWKKVLTEDDLDTVFSREIQNLKQSGATDGQVAKWNDSAGEWQPSNESVGVSESYVDSVIAYYTYPADTLTSSRNITAADAYKTLCLYTGSAVLTIPSALSVPIGTKIIVQVGNGADVDITAAAGVDLNFATAKTVSLVSTSGNVATRVLQYKGLDPVSSNPVWLLSNE